MIRASPLLTTYGAPVDRVWACELLRGKPASTQPAPGAANDWGNHGGGQTQRRPAPKLRESALAPHQESGGACSAGPAKSSPAVPAGAGRSEGGIEAVASSAARGKASSVGGGIGNQILRGMLGSILGDGAETGRPHAKNRSLSSTTRVNVNLSLPSPLQASRLVGFDLSGRY
jgi:hypothetical protein